MFREIMAKMQARVLQFIWAKRCMINHSSFRHSSKTNWAHNYVHRIAIFTDFIFFGLDGFGPVVYLTF
jgi:hypothetical protein